MTLSIIVAIGANNEIGIRNALPWSLPADLRYFKEITAGHTVLMGYNTFLSLPNGPLPNRQNIVLCDIPGVKLDHCQVFSSLDEALIKLSGEQEVFIIGGCQVYRQTLSLATKFYLTRVHACFPEADVFFPEVDWTEWEKISEKTLPVDEKNSHSVTFYVYEKKEIE